MVQGRTTFVSGHIDSFESISLALIDVYVVRPWHILDIEFISFRRINRNSFFNNSIKQNLRASLDEVRQHPGKPPCWFHYICSTYIEYIPVQMNIHWSSCRLSYSTRHALTTCCGGQTVYNGMKVFVHSHFLLFNMYKLKLIFLLI